MNPNWKSFLRSENATVDNDAGIVFPAATLTGDKLIYPVAHLAVLTVAGKDAAKLLQGQMTCNINDISETQSSLGAFCNPKGRALATFLLVKKSDAYLLVLPAELLEPVKARLQKYVLRSDVSFTDSSDDFCLIGIRGEAGQPRPLFSTSRRDVVSVNLSSAGSRALIIAEADQAVAYWSERAGQGYQPANSEDWRYLDLVSGIPWLDAATSEEFIPQMLNLDMLGGISFNKGCYTGQEIVARTHYLGKAKRALFLAECDLVAAPEPNAAIIDASTGTEQSAGQVLLALNRQDTCTLLAVLQLSETGVYDLTLKDHPEVKLRLLPLNT